jgi:hypothetical protein
MHGLKPEDVRDLDFRAGDWPGGIWATLQDGERKKVLKLEEMKDEFNLLKKFYTPNRCSMCIDFSAEYADLAVGDPWLRGRDGEYLYPDSRTTVLTRTERGDQVVQAATDAGSIRVKEISLKTFMMNFEKSARYKREAVPQNMEIWRRLRRRVPTYTRELPPSAQRVTAASIVSFLIARLSAFRWFRRWALRLAQTRPFLSYYRWNRHRKATRFVSTYAATESFVDSIMPPPPASTERQK